MQEAEGKEVDKYLRVRSNQRVGGSGRSSSGILVVILKYFGLMSSSTLGERKKAISNSRLSSRLIYREVHPPLYS